MRTGSQSPPRAASFNPWSRDIAESGVALRTGESSLPDESFLPAAIPSSARMSRPGMISIVIVSFNAREHLRRCLSSVYEHQAGDFEVIVVDNASADGSADMVAAGFPRARLVRHRKNMGFSVGANAGASQAGGDVIAFVNPDCTVDADAFSGPARFLRQNPDVGALGIKVLDPSGGLQLSVRRFPGLSVAVFNRYSMLTKLWPSNPLSRRYLMSDWDHDSITDVDWVSGACLLTTAATLGRIGYFDEGYFWGFEDVDFCQRVHRAGMRVVYFPETSVHHEIGASARTVPSKALIARHRGIWRYYRTYLRRGFPIDAAVFSGVWLRCAAMVTSGFLRRSLPGARSTSPRSVSPSPPGGAAS